MKYIAVKSISNNCSIGIKEADEETVAFDVVTSDKILSQHKRILFLQVRKQTFLFE